MERLQSRLLFKPSVSLEEAQDLLQSGEIEKLRVRARLAYSDAALSWCTLPGCDFHSRSARVVIDHYMDEHLNAGPGQPRVCRWCDYSNTVSLLEHARKSMHEKTSKRSVACWIGCGKSWFSPWSNNTDVHFDGLCPNRNGRPPGQHGRDWYGPTIGFLPVSVPSDAPVPPRSLDEQPPINNNAHLGNSPLHSHPAAYSFPQLDQAPGDYEPSYPANTPESLLCPSAQYVSDPTVDINQHQLSHGRSQHELFGLHAIPPSDPLQVERRPTISLDDIIWEPGTAQHSTAPSALPPSTLRQIPRHSSAHVHMPSHHLSSPWRFDPNLPSVPPRAALPPPFSVQHPQQPLETQFGSMPPQWNAFEAVGRRPRSPYANCESLPGYDYQGALTRWSRVNPPSESFLHGRSRHRPARSKSPQDRTRENYRSRD